VLEEIDIVPRDVCDWLESRVDVVCRCRRETTDVQQFVAIYNMHVSGVVIWTTTMTLFTVVYEPLVHVAFDVLPVAIVVELLQ
jgi:hypothetical protein